MANIYTNDLSVRENKTSDHAAAFFRPATSNAASAIAVGSGIKGNEAAESCAIWTGVRTCEQGTEMGSDAPSRCPQGASPYTTSPTYAPFATCTCIVRKSITNEVVTCSC